MKVRCELWESCREDCGHKATHSPEDNCHEEREECHRQDVAVICRYWDELACCWHKPKGEVKGPAIAPVAARA